eukprot:5871301-Pyramimonas_sp.AAC.1
MVAYSRGVLLHTPLQGPPAPLRPARREVGGAEREAVREGGRLLQRAQPAGGAPRPDHGAAPRERRRPDRQVREN